MFQACDLGLRLRERVIAGLLEDVLLAGCLPGRLHHGSVGFSIPFVWLFNGVGVMAWLGCVIMQSTLLSAFLYSLFARVFATVFL